MNKDVLRLSTRNVVAIGIGAALYAATSMISITVGPNTSLRLAIALLTILGSIFGPVVGFFVGFIGHALNDAMMYGGIWWSWTFMSASVGMFAGLIALKPDFNVLEGKLEKVHIKLMYLYAVGGALVGSILSYVGDVFAYGEPADKVWFQIILANIMNMIVVFALGIPVVIALAKRKASTNNLEEDN